MHARTFRPALTLALTLAGVGSALAACASGSQPAPETQSAPGTTTVRLLAHESFVVSESLVTEFEKQTGYDLEIITGGDAGQVVAGAILAAGSPSADVLFGVDNSLTSKAVDAGVFTPYTPAAIANLKTALQSDTAGGLVSPVDYGDVCVNLDDSYFAEHAITRPQSLDDLIKPEYQDLLVVEDPAASSPGLAFLLATIARYGDAWPAYWEGLRNNGVLVTGSWTDAYLGEFSGGGDGTRPLVVSYATSPPAEIVYAEEPKPSEPSTSVMTDGCYRQVEYAGVLAGTPNEPGAQAVVDWLLSEPVQEDVPLSMFVFPARADVSLPQVFTDFAAAVDDPLQLEPADVSANLSTWLEQWGEIMDR